MSTKNKSASKNKEVIPSNDIQIDKTSDKYKVVLKFINVILSNLGKPTIIDLCDFKDIDREDIIKDVNKTALDDMAEELFSHFNKKKSGYYRKTDAIVLNCLRGIMKEIGHELTYDQKDRYEIIDGTSYKRSHSFYSINLSEK